jgi:hypothetical protein
MFSGPLTHWILSFRGLIDMIWLTFLLVILRHFWRERTFLKQSQSWLITKGLITQCEWTQEGTHLWPKIMYSYEVFDREFIGEHLFLDTAHNNPNSHYARQVAYRAAMAFKENREIDIYYNPNNPQQAALDLKIPKKLTLIIYLLILLITFHLSLIIVTHLS